MDRPVSAVQLALCGALHPTRPPRQIAADHLKQAQPFGKGRFRPAVSLRAVQIPPRFLPEPKSVGYMELALVLPFPLNVLDIAHGGLEAFGEKPASDLTALLMGQRDRRFLLPGKALDDLKALRGPAVAADPILKSLLFHIRSWSPGKSVFGVRPSVFGYPRTSRQKSGSAWQTWVFATFQHI